MTRYRLLAVDLDGTLLGPDSRLTPRTRWAMERAIQEYAVDVVIATGRRFHSARPIARDAGLTTPLVTHNGALVKDIETAAVHHYQPLDVTVARELLAVGKTFGADTIALDDPEGDGRILTDGVSERNAALRYYLEINRQYVHQVDDLRVFVKEPVTQVMFCGPCAAMQSLAQVLERDMATEARLLVTTYPHNDMTILDLMHPSCSKATGIAYVASQLGVAPEEILAVGDNYNDLDMLRYAGRGILMGNAEPELKAMGFELTAPNTEDGVAQVIETYIFGQPTSLPGE
ncbi:HAD family phosphatase [Chloracidobacterium sp. MS 40/45]|uniref:Cof-type HAD-IIB family hydrolase n=1 Tax=Chloracidobacterium aggregatum TaxID=2851959 RepID=UPI001B8BB0E4|nr:Cof-type HAD-IIB family hydrolase [Chloracidobacterium aggregatum]QUW00263.1 HAD family phosphatase [Chloracidobacterium sp. MS 40/45]